MGKRFYEAGVCGPLLRHLNYKFLSVTLKIKPPFSFEILRARDILLDPKKKEEEPTDYSGDAQKDDYEKADKLERDNRRRFSRRGGGYSSDDSSDYGRGRRF